MSVVVDEKNLAKLSTYSWFLNRTCVPVTIIDGKQVAMSRVISGVDSTPMNGNPLDCRECNFTTREGKRGVVHTKTRTGDRYSVWIEDGGKPVKRGVYSNRDEAEIEHDRLVKSLYGDAGACIRVVDPCRIQLGTKESAAKKSTRRGDNDVKKRIGSTIPAGCKVPIDPATGIVGVARLPYTEDDHRRMKILNRGIDDAYLVSFWNEYGGVIE